MKAFSRLRMLANKLLAYQDRQLTPIDRWEIITNKLLKKNLNKDVSWYGGFKVTKIKVIDRYKKINELEFLGRWSKLINGMLKLDLKQ